MWSRLSPLIHSLGFNSPTLTRFVVRHRCVIDLHRRVIDASSTCHRCVIDASSVRHRRAIGASSVRHHNQSGGKRVVGDKDPEAAG